VIFDCVIYAQEKELLLLRFMEYYSVVDLFVVVEAKQTHQNNPRELDFPEHMDLWLPYMDKVCYVTVDRLPRDPEDIFGAERFQRDQCEKALLGIAEPGDAVIISDVDEFWDVAHADVIRETAGLTIFDHRLYYYYVDLLSPRPWLGAAAAPYGMFSPREQRRLARAGKGRVVGGGWHYAYTGGVDWLEHKYHNIADNDLTKPAPDYARLIAEQRHPTGETGLGFVPIDNGPRSLGRVVEMFPYLVGGHGATR